METTAPPEQKIQHRRGPRPMAERRKKASFMIPLDLWDWAASQPESGSALIRKLLEAERARRTVTPSPQE